MKELTSSQNDAVYDATIMLWNELVKVIPTTKLSNKDFLNLYSEMEVLYRKYSKQG